MKKIISLSIIMLLQFAPAKAQWVTLPDTNFVNKLTQLFPSCMNGNQMDTMCTEIVNVDSLNLDNLFLTDITGIRYFDNLTYLRCHSNQLTSLPALPNSLLELHLFGNQLTSLPILPASMKKLFCWNNQITALPNLPNSLTDLYCNNNQLTTLPTLPDSLLRLNCSYNGLSTLPSFPNTLAFVLCTNLNLTSLPSIPNSMYFLSCQNNQLTNLPSVPYLRYLFCGNNQLSFIPNLYDSIIEFSCHHNQLSDLPFLPNTMTYLDCSYNQITSISAVRDTMEFFRVQSNNINCFSNLPYVSIADSIHANISNNMVTCVPNLQIYSVGLPLCISNDSINNPNNCASDINISGNIFKDMNNNCLLNVGDTLTTNIPVKLFDSLNILISQTYSVNGVYGFSVNQAGSYKVEIENNNSPIIMDCAQADTQIVNVITPALNTSNIDFPVLCNQSFETNVHSLYTVGWVFPGQEHKITTNLITNETWYNLICDTTIHSGTVIVEVSGPVSYVSPALGALLPIVNGNTFLYNITDFNSLTTESFDLKFTTNTNAQTGAQVCVHVEINPTPQDVDTTNNSYDFCYQVVNSFDPNMKEVYPVNVLPGYDNWFTYTIHFQNTGNAPAFNIRLRDTLDANLDINSFEVRGYSHPAQISINGNILTVKFNNIMLPDATTNYEGSMGYFQYRLKPLPNLPIGTQIENTAYIYFDYNAPIITNTTQNNFEMPVNSINAIPQASHLSLSPNPSNGIFTFNESKNIKTVEVYNMMGELVLRQGNAKQINLQGYPKGIYMVRINGMQVIRLVKE